jgi:FtsP/CotA-like multicopper oxidase with cupredoxin domain
MRTKKLTLNLGALALTLATLPLASNQAQAVEYYLQAASTTVQMPDGTSVPMWGYGMCVDSSNCGSVTVPGPALTVPAGDATLTVHLINCLSVPTSLVVNGLIKPMAPVWDNGAIGSRPSTTARVRSFDVEAASSANGSCGAADYTWSNVKPGTYLYQSGTQAQVQVQLGLYGAVTKNAVEADPLAATAVRAEAYSGVGYDNQATLLYSEIDPALHAAVAGGTYGTAPSPTSTLDYQPKYFLINGQPYPGSAVINRIGNPGTTLLRLLNAGLTTHVPMIHGAYWTVVAEDGKPYAYSRNQYTALLPAAKTLDVLLTPDIGGAVYSILDRRLSLSNNGVSDGGMLAFLQYSAQGGLAGTTSDPNPPIANPDNYDTVRGVTLNVGASAGLLANDDNTDGLPFPIKAVAASGTTASGGSYALSTNGSFSYTPLATYTGSDTFTYQVTDGKTLSSSTVTVNVSSPVAPTLASLDPFDRQNAIGLGTSWSQIVNTTSSQPNLQIVSNTATAMATDLGGMAIWVEGSTTQGMFGPSQAASFTLGTVAQSAGLILKATGPDSKAPVNLIRVRVEEAGDIVVSTLMGGSGTGVYVKQATFAAAATGGNTLTAAVDAKGLVTVFLGSMFVGGVQLPDVAVWKGPGRIGIQLQAVGASTDNFSGGSL